MDNYVKEFKTSELTPGMITGAYVKTPTGQIIVHPGVTLTSALITRIVLYKIPAVTIFVEVTPAPNPSPAIPENVSQKSASTELVFRNTQVKRETTLIKHTDKIAAPAHTGGTANPTYSQQVKLSSSFFSFEKSFAVSIGEITHYFSKVREGTISMDMKAIADALSALANVCHTSIDFFDMLHNMRQNNDSVYAHCLNVALISRQMGIWLKLSSEDIEILTIAGLFHDIGKLKLPLELLNKKERLTEEEFHLIKQHPQFGYDILKKQSIDPRVKKSALQHHERCDGSGYPLGLVTEEIDNFSQIIAIADVYDAMTAARAYRSPLCPFQVIAEFEKDGLQKYNPKYILTFLDQIAKTYQNNRVLLSNGKSANIVLLNDKHLSQPVVQLNDGACIDLSSSELFIKALI